MACNFFMNKDLRYQVRLVQMLSYTSAKHNKKNTKSYKVHQIIAT